MLIVNQSKKDGIHLSPHVTYFIREKKVQQKSSRVFSSKKIHKKIRKKFSQDKSDLIDCHDPSIGVSIHPTIEDSFSHFMIMT